MGRNDNTVFSWSRQATLSWLPNLGRIRYSVFWDLLRCVTIALLIAVLCVVAFSNVVSFCVHYQNPNPNRGLALWVAIESTLFLKQLHKLASFGFICG
jgi:hypothetical protein